MQVATPYSGLLLVGHGSRSPQATKQFLALVQQFAEQLAQQMKPMMVEAAFLELQQPGIEEGVQRLLARGVERLMVAPLLLFAAGHAKRDIPEAVEAALARCGRRDLLWRQARPLGCHPAVLKLSRRRMAESREQGAGRRGQESGGSTCLLLVGRGSPDESATAEMREFAHRRQLQEGGMRSEVAFLAMARPLLEEKLTELATADLRQIVVQPHLLFEGELAESLRQQVAAAARANPRQEWLIAPLLADAVGQAGVGTALLLEAITDRCRECECYKKRQ